MGSSVPHFISCFLIKGFLPFPQPTLPSNPHSITLLFHPHSPNSCKNFILFHFFVRTLEPDIFWDMNMGRRWAIIINRSTFKYTPSYISNCSFIGLCRIEILSLSLRNCSSKYDTSQDIFINP